MRTAGAPAASRISITELAPRIASGSVRAERLTEDALNAIAGHNPRLNAFITVMADAALAAARDRS